MFALDNDAIRIFSEEQARRDRRNRRLYWAGIFFWLVLMAGLIIRVSDIEDERAAAGKHIGDIPAVVAWDVEHFEINH